MRTNTHVLKSKSTSKLFTFRTNLLQMLQRRVNKGITDFECGLYNITRILNFNTAKLQFK